MFKKISQKGVDLLKELEGFEPQAYKDIAGIWTIGFGFTEDVKEGDTITEEDAELRLKLELIKYESCINKYVARDLNQNQFDALVIFCYNIGTGAFIGSTLCRILNRHEPFEECAKQFLRWNKAAGRVSKGLTNRRIKEMNLFLTKE